MIFLYFHNLTRSGDTDDLNVEVIWQCQRPGCVLLVSNLGLEVCKHHRHEERTEITKQYHKEYDRLRNKKRKEEAKLFNEQQELLGISFEKMGHVLYFSFVLTVHVL